MKKYRKRQLLVGSTVVVCILFITTLFVGMNKKSSGYEYLEGFVTAYDVSPSLSDGSIVFAIDNQSINIGGGLRIGENATGEIYSPIKINDRVKAKVAKSENGDLTLVGCSECYIRKN